MRKRRQFCFVGGGMVNNQGTIFNSPKFPKQISDVEKLILTTYSPRAFDEIRQTAGQQSADFAQILGKGLKPFKSNSKSGAAFYFTKNDRLMVKTIKKEEMKCLLSKLSCLHTHCLRHTSTLLARVFAAHKLQYGSRKLYIITCESIWDPTKFVHLIYDLKGSIKSRNASKTDLEVVPESNQTSIILKDNDAREAQRSCYVGPEKARRINSQLNSDIDFLANTMGVLDYSLLIGIHYPSIPAPPLVYAPGAQPLPSRQHRRPNLFKSLDFGEEKMTLDSLAVLDTSSASAASGAVNNTMKSLTSATDLRVGTTTKKSGAAGGDGNPNGSARLSVSARSATNSGAGAASQVLVPGVDEGDIINTVDSISVASSRRGSIWHREGKTNGETDLGKGDLCRVSFDSRREISGELRGGHGRKDSDVSVMTTEGDFFDAEQVDKQESIVATPEMYWGKGAVEGKDGKEIYFFGIIDYLVEFGFLKKGEYLFKSKVQGLGQKMSVMPPKEYGIRFKSYLSTMFH